MRRLFGGYGLFIVTAIIVFTVMIFALSGKDSGFLGANNLGSIKPAQTTKSENNSATIQSLYAHKDPKLVITPVTLSVGSTYDFYTDFTTEALEYASDGSTTDIKSSISITEMSFLSKNDLSTQDLTKTDIDLSGVDLSSYTVPKKGIYEITYLLTDTKGFQTQGTYQFPCD